MGISFSCPLAAYNDLETGLESVTVKSISFGDDEVKTPVRSISFNDGETEPTILRSIGSGKMMIEGSVRIKTRGAEMPFSTEGPLLKEKSACIIPLVSDRKERENQSLESDSMMKKMQVPILCAGNPKHEAATKLQKVYKSFRTRRRLADCAVLIEQSWWKLLDFAELKRSSVSFFDIEKHETAISRWSRARTRAAKVGKGLSKNGKARKLARQHWLEAIDPRHRYGHNLHFYYVKWLQSQSNQPFFYWLDIGEGKEINHVEKCPRSKLQQQCIKYLGPRERKAYEVAIEDGKLFYKQTGEALDTTEPKGAKWIFVLSTSMILYVGKKKKGTFQHSSFLAGGVASAAGRLVVEKGILKAVWPHSGHYQPTQENFRDFISFLMENNVDLTDIKTNPVDGDESCGKQNDAFLRRSTSEEDLTGKIDDEDWTSEKADSTEDTAATLESPKLGPSSILTKNYSGCFEILESENQMESMSDGYHTSEEVDIRDLTTERITSAEDTNAAIGPSGSLRRKLTDLTVPNGADSLKRFKIQKEADGYGTAYESSASEEYKQVDNVLKQSSDEKDSETKNEIIPKECVLQRINSWKELKSYHLGKQLSSRWTTGAGARIGCLRDYPSELQFHALEQVNLSPRSARCLRSDSP